MARRIRAQQGLISMLLAVTLVLTLGTSLILSQLGERRDAADRQTRTQQRLLALRQAMVNFASVNGYLPCPASGALETGLAVPNVAANACTNPNGTVPWTTLGLPRDAALDAWGRKVSYRVFAGATGVTVAGGASLVQCDSDFASPALTASAAAVAPNFQCTALPPRTDPASVLAAATRRGLAVFDEGAQVTTVYQVAFALISHGASGAGAWVPGGARLALPAVANAVERANGLVLDAVNVPIPPAGACPLPPAAMPANPVCHYRRNPTDATVALTDNNHFDDQVVYMTLTDLLAAAGRGARNW
ncbi:MAG: hypothetical protein FGM55_09530 [Rhodoferax sp.]|nr:hypothetical protein [Rhodoferax sp.]